MSLPCGSVFPRHVILGILSVANCLSYYPLVYQKMREIIKKTVRNRSERVSKPRMKEKGKMAGYLEAPIMTRKGPRTMRMQDVLVHGPRVLADRVRNLDRCAPGALLLNNAFMYESAEAARHGFAMHTTPAFDRLTEPDLLTPYGRLGHPNGEELDAKLLYAHGLTTESGYSAQTYGSGMAAIFLALIVSTRPGDEIIIDTKDNLYGCVGRLTKVMEQMFGRKIVFVDFDDSPEGQARLAAAITDKTRVIYAETLTNPKLKLNNIAKLATVANEANQAQKRDTNNKIRLIIDNTFLGPLFCRPWEIVREAVPSDPDLLIIVESLTKIIGGFGLDMGGTIIAPKHLIHDIDWEDVGLIALRDFVGSVLSPFHAFEFSNRSLPTYVDRSKTAEQVALRFAQYLETVKGRWVSSVTYPGLDSYPQRALAARMLHDYDGEISSGFMLGFTFYGDVDTQERAATRFMDRVAQQGYDWTFMVSLGQVRSLIEVPTLMTHFGSGMPMFARVSIGTESPVTLVEETEANFEYAYAA